MMGWRERARLASERTFPIDVLQERGKRAERVIISLKENNPKWRELSPSHPVRVEILRQEQECTEKMAILIERGVEPLFGCGNLDRAGVSLAGNPSDSQEEMADVSVDKLGTKAGATYDPDVAKRRAIVKSNPSMSAIELCQMLDREKVPLPSKWQESGFRSWAAAYKDSKYRSRVQVIFTKDKAD